MPEKVKLPREVADAIAKLINERFSPYRIVCMMHEGKSYDDRISLLRQYAIDNENKLMHALVNGYEVEETPEDVVRNFYKTWSEVIKHEIQGYAACRFRIEGMITTLNALNIKIKGVNA